MAEDQNAASDLPPAANQLSACQLIGFVLRASLYFARMVIAITLLPWVLYYAVPVIKQIYNDHQIEPSAVTSLLIAWSDFIVLYPASVVCALIVYFVSHTLFGLCTKWNGLLIEILDVMHCGLMVIGMVALIGCFNAVAMAASVLGPTVGLHTNSGANPSIE